MSLSAALKLMYTATNDRMLINSEQKENGYSVLFFAICPKIIRTSGFEVSFESLGNKRWDSYMKGVFALEWVKVVLMVSILAKIKAKHLAQLSFFCLSVFHTCKCEYEEQKFRLYLLGRIMRQLSFIEGRSVNGILCIQRVRNFMLRFSRLGM
jgi:hypothetical protein